jgi:hypothetical protein
MHPPSADVSTKDALAPTLRFISPGALIFGCSRWKIPSRPGLHEHQSHMLFSLSLSDLKKNLHVLVSNFVYKISKFKSV